MQLRYNGGTGLLGRLLRWKMDSPAAANAAHSINLIQGLAANMADFFHGYSIPQFVTFKMPDIMLTVKSSDVSRI